MPKKKRDKNRLAAVIVSAFLITSATLWAGCDGITPESKTSPPIPHKLGDITLKGSTPSVILTPTAAVSPEPESAGIPAAGKTVPDKGTAGGPPPVVKKGPDGTVKKPAETAVGPPQRGEFSIQIGAYLLPENLSHTKEEIVSLGFTPYVSEIRQKIKMNCVIVGKAPTEKEAREIVTALTEKGFDARLLPNNDNTVDAAGGIYYYRKDASAAEDKIRALGYAARVEERAVEVVLQSLRIGGYHSPDEAQKDLDALKLKGFSPVILKSDE